MAFLIKLSFFLASLLPVRLNGAIGAGLGRFLYLVDARHRNIAIRNLNRVYPDKDLAWKIRIAHESFAELGRTAFELSHVYMRSKAFLWSRIEFDGWEQVEAAKKRGHGIMFVASHHSNWELGALAVSPTHSLYRAVRQHGLEVFVKASRERFGNRLYDRDGNMRWLPRVLRQGKAVSMMVDQHLSTATPVPFMGHTALTTTLPAAYAHKYQTPMFTAMLHRIGRGFHFRLELREIKLPQENENKEEYLLQCTQLISDTLAEGIHRRPELWLWLHRRWLYLDEQEQA